jgi:hypothetical protein
MGNGTPLQGILDPAGLYRKKVDPNVQFQETDTSFNQGGVDSLAQLRAQASKQTTPKSKTSSKSLSSWPN